MATHTTYYPVRIGDQIIWVRNFSNKIGNYRTTLGYTTAEITAIQADAARIIWLLETLQSSAQAFAQAITGHLRLMLDGPAGSALVEPPVFVLPTVPETPDNVLPGALKRIFAFVANLKTRAGYTDAIAQDLGIIGAQTTVDPNAVPPVKVEVRSGEVLIHVKKMGHTGFQIDGQVANETEWTTVGIGTSDPFHDNRPLKVPGQPEKRRYRVCFWDGEPTRVWSAVIEVVFGG